MRSKVAKAEKYDFWCPLLLYGLSKAVTETKAQMIAPFSLYALDRTENSELAPASFSISCSTTSPGSCTLISSHTVLHTVLQRYFEVSYFQISQCLQGQPSP